MKRLVLATIVLGIFVAPVRAQSSNCMYLTAYVSSDAKTYGAQNQYIASETVTWTYTCTNQNDNTSTTGTNAVTATGAGGYSNNGTVNACNPIWGYAIGNPPTTASNNYLQNVGQNQLYDTSGSGTCVPSNYNIKTTYCQAVACNTTSGGGGGTGGGPPTYCDPDAYPSGCSPIILDVSGNGFFLTSAAGGVSFDISGTGHPIQIGWTAANSGNAFLALPGADGLIHSGKQLFGNFTPQPPSTTPNGFAALAVYDLPANGGNGDGIIDSQDAIFASLRLWIDANHDGISQPNELFPLPSLGVNSISLTYKLTARTDQYGNYFRYRAVVNPGDPANVGRAAYDVFFVTLPLPTTKNIPPLIPDGHKCPVPVPTKGGMLSSAGGF